MNCPCAKVLAFGQNACTAQKRRPAVRGPGSGWHQYFADKTKKKHLLCRCFFFGYLGNLKCSGQMNCPCAKVLAFGQNACTAQKRRPAVRGPGFDRHLCLADKAKSTSTDRGLSIFTFSLFSIHSSLKPTGRFLGSKK